MYRCFLLHTCLCTAGMQYQQRPENDLGFLGLEFQVVAAHCYEGTKTSTWMTWKGSQYFQLLTHLSNPLIYWFSLRSILDVQQLKCSLAHSFNTLSCVKTLVSFDRRHAASPCWWSFCTTWSCSHLVLFLGIFILLPQSLTGDWLYLPFFFPKFF